MISKSRSLLLAATILVAPIGMAMAQGTGTAGAATSQAPASPSATTTTTPYRSSAAANPNVPGATGQTVVPGSTSSMASSGRVQPNPNKASTDAGAATGGK
jgi:hypothetical protein